MEWITMFSKSKNKKSISLLRLITLYFFQDTVSKFDISCLMHCMREIPDSRTETKARVQQSVLHISTLRLQSENRPVHFVLAIHVQKNQAFNTLCQNIIFRYKCECVDFSTSVRFVAWTERLVMRVGDYKLVWFALVDHFRALISQCIYTILKSA